jgi:hypothetical protein
MLQPINVALDDIFLTNAAAFGFSLSGKKVRRVTLSDTPQEVHCRERSGVSCKASTATDTGSTLPPTPPSPYFFRLS